MSDTQTTATGPADTPPDKEPQTVPILPKNFLEYENGKERRYEILFKVNGAAFAIATFAGDGEKAKLLYQILGVQTLAWGMMAFTILIGIDIFAFGWGMKQLDTQYVKKSYIFTLGRKVTPFFKGVFEPIGMFVLVIIVALIAGGWLLVACRAPTSPPLPDPATQTSK